MLYENISSNPEALGEVVGAIIGVVGLIIGTFVSIFTSLLIRHLDIKREERRDFAETERDRKARHFALQQEVYSTFITELANFESILTKKDFKTDIDTLEEFQGEWTKTEIKVDLVANNQVIKLKNQLSTIILGLAEEKFLSKKNKNIVLEEDYIMLRNNLLENIRQEMGIQN